MNSLLILSDQLCKNPGGNLTPKQVEFSKTIHASGNDLLTLINDILDLSKIESGTVVVDPTDLLLDDLQRYVERTFRHVAEAKNVDFFIRLDTRLPKSMFADVKRLQQVLKNLLSNAFKFTHQGHVTLTIEPVRTRLESAEREPQPRRRRHRVLGDGHRHRNFAGQAADHFRGVPAGGRQHEPEVRRHRARDWRSAASCRGCWVASCGW